MCLVIRLIIPFTLIKLGFWVNNDWMFARKQEKELNIGPFEGFSGNEIFDESSLIITTVLVSSDLQLGLSRNVPTGKSGIEKFYSIFPL